MMSAPSSAGRSPSPAPRPRPLRRPWHTPRYTALRLAVYLHLTLLLEQHFLFDSGVRLHFPPPPSLSPKSNPLFRFPQGRPSTRRRISMSRGEGGAAPEGEGVPPGHPLLREAQQPAPAAQLDCVATHRVALSSTSTSTPHVF
ncbi:hypothetical protein FB451DRAFT_1555689, partial [Mycena latifolia]